MTPDRSPYEILVDSVLLRSYRGSQEAVDDFLEQHRKLDLNPYVDCADNTCRWARNYADEIFETLKAHGLGIVPVYELPEEQYDELLRLLDEPPKVNEKLRNLMNRGRP